MKEFNQHCDLEVYMGSLLRKIGDGADRIDHQIGKFQCLSGNTLKVIAILTMLIDHLCKIVLQWLLSNYWWPMMQEGKITFEQYQSIDYFIRFNLQGVGTIAFPLFCYLLAEGFRYTRNRKRYIGMMLFFALISEIPFDIAFFSRYSMQEGTFPFYWNYQNVFFTLFLSLLSLACIDRFPSTLDMQTSRKKALVWQIVGVAVLAVVADLICCDYGSMGILFVVAFYLCCKNRIYQILVFLLTYMITTGNQPTIYILIACLVILLYNGKRGKMKIKYAAYAFYPIHITILYLVTLASVK